MFAWAQLTIEAKTTKDEAAIRELIDGLVAAIRAKNIDGVMASYATDLVAFDIVPPLQFVSATAYKTPWQDVFERFQTIDYEVRDLDITASDEVAFSHSLNRIHGTMTNGQKTDLWLRLTACYRKIRGRWLIVHLQASVLAGLFGKPALVCLVAVTIALTVASLFTSGNLDAGTEEDRSNRWVLGALAVIGVVSGWLPAYTDRRISGRSTVTRCGGLAWCYSRAAEYCACGRCSCWVIGLAALSRSSAIIDWSPPVSTRSSVIPAIWACSSRFSDRVWRFGRSSGSRWQR